MFNETDGDFNDVAIRTFKIVLAAEHDLRKSLTKKPVRKCIGLWITLMNTNVVRKTDSKGREKLRIKGYDMKRVMVDQGSGVEIMYPNLYKGLNLKPEDLTTYDSLLVSFDGKVVIQKGQIRLPLQAGLEVVEVDFIVVYAYSPYIAIVARPWLHALGAVSSTLHLKQSWNPILSIDAVLEELKCERLEEIAIDGDPKKFFQVGTQLPPQEKEELLAFLRWNIDVSAWNAYEALGVDPDFICHHLNVNPTVLFRKQPPWHSSKEQSDAIKEEVNKLK
ncbi:uncharacterized protein LOC126708313 [Quercus robur]|uniref:uncharacterized protein LOC126708313 n=1 Tax=Quercus robur TaxID=38942 RepID=UPI00216123A9|nr:uncharacterized protein LOC126708313 [Quercus robur]